MSANAPSLPPSPADFRARKGGTPLVCLTAYTTPVARLVDSHCDLVLVGDSLGMVLHGLPSTLGVTLDMMILHGKAVARGISKATLIVDLPFGSYEAGPQAAFESAARIMRETGAAGGKLEGGVHMAPTIRFLVERSIPVMAHVGLTPQSVHVLGGYKVQGRDRDADRVMADARAVAEAGAFSVVLEKIPASLARRITDDVPIPTIGIGASQACDGQILVVDDMLGLFTEFRPKFVKRYADLGALANEAIAQYAAEVRSRSFPASEHSFGDVAPEPKAKK
jgi:3-methyl-2-oxobutanoate hydroxymethyltransferase